MAQFKGTGTTNFEDRCQVAELFKARPSARKTQNPKLQTQNYNPYVRCRRAKEGMHPLEVFKLWFEESVRTAGDREPNAMTLATTSREGAPSARVVLLKGFDERGLIFFTNYKSRKDQQLAENPSAAVNFHWPWLERQIQIEGRAEKASREESEIYFNKRPIVTLGED